MRILKFGGSSLATADSIRQVAAIILENMRREPVVIVVSAFQRVTNELLECARLAEREMLSGNRCGVKLSAGIAAR